MWASTPSSIRSLSVSNSGPAISTLWCRSHARALSYSLSSDGCTNVASSLKHNTTMTKKIYLALMALTVLAWSGCKDSDEAVSPGKTGPKPTMELAASPTENARYGDKISVSGLITDERNLDKYDMVLLNGAGDTLAQKTQALLGQTFHVNDALQIPLPQNASPDNLKLIFRLDNTRNGEEV